MDVVLQIEAVNGEACALPSRAVSVGSLLLRARARARAAADAPTADEPDRVHAANYGKAVPGALNASLCARALFLPRAACSCC